MVYLAGDKIEKEGFGLKDQRTTREREEEANGIRVICESHAILKQFNKEPLGS